MYHPKIIVIDCDGVLTDGKVRYTSEGIRTKEFHSRDITAIKRLIASGFTVWVVSKSSWYGLKYFVKRTGANYALGVKDKAEWAERMLHGEPFVVICDDLDDLELCRMAHFVFVPESASMLLKNALHNNKKTDDQQKYEIMHGYPGGSGVIDYVEELLINQA